MAAGAFERLAGRRGRCALITALAVAATSLCAAPALAAPGTWGITMTHLNPYGLQKGLDPNSNSETTFARESGFNTYTLTVTGTGEAGKGNRSVDETLNCIGPAVGSVTYQWLRNGAPIAEANSRNYVLAASDENKVVQCRVAVSNAEATTAGVSSGALVGTPSEPPPAAGTVKLSTEGNKPVGTSVTCSTKWSGAPVFTYQWLRSGAPIEGVTGEKYTIAPADEGKPIQCQVTAKNAGGAAIAISASTGEGSLMGGVTEEDERLVPGASASIAVATVIDQLPPGMALGGSEEKEALHEVVAQGWSCEIATGAREVECANASPPPYKTITLHVHVLPQALDPSTNIASIRGAGAPSANTGEEGKTTVTPAVPFGIETFTPTVVESLGSPFSAGEHPFSVETLLLFNHTTSDAGFLVTAGSAAKGVIAEVPPGFVGNPQNAAQCPIESLKTGVQPCPAASAIGFTQVTLLEGRIHKGTARPFPPLVPDAPTLVEREKESSDLLKAVVKVYNMQTTPGHPAVFGFLAVGLPVQLEADVRSNGDYGITLSDKALPNGPKLLGASVTFCGYGVDPKAKSPNLVCGKEPKTGEPEAPKPFLTYPPKCSSSNLVWTIKANPWIEPSAYVEKKAQTPAPTGCNLVQFHPEIEFKPSRTSEGGTTQADEPTGMTFNLKAPQTNEVGVNATSNLKNVVMTLPAGMTVSPAAADGLKACSNEQFGLGSTVEPAQPASCPPASQVGTVEAFTPLLSGAPTIEGVAQVGAGLVCSPGRWSHGPELSFQWLRNGVAIHNATGKEYGPVPADEGNAVQCQVTASNAGGSSAATSKAAAVFTKAELVGKSEFGPVMPSPPSSIAAPTGTASAGNTLTCNPGAWTGKATLTYRWLRGAETVPGAEGPEYTLSSADEGKVIECQVVGKNAGVVVADSAPVVASPEPSTAPPLPGGVLQGQVFVAEPECSPCTEAKHDAANGKLIRLFIQLRDPAAGVVVKLHGTTKANEETGQLETVFNEQPQQPFELLQLKLNGGARATLATPQTCGTAKTVAKLTPWSAPEEPKTSESSFEVSSDGAGGACLEPWPFRPSFGAGTTGSSALTAGSFTEFSLNLGREDREQNLSGVTVRMPPGLTAKLASVPLCGDAQANAGTCGPESQVGTTTTGAGAGPHPFFLGGQVYLTGPYKGAPFGLSIVVPAVAGPFNLGKVVVRSAIYVDPNTAAATVVSDPLPQKLDGVPFRLRRVNVSVNRPGFMLNPTNCTAKQVSATLSSDQNKSVEVSSPFDVGACTNLPFSPTLTASTGAKTSKANGASLTVTVTSGAGQANIGKASLILPRSLPSRLTTIQKACRGPVFAVNPAACPEGSVVGIAIAHTPVLKNPLTGPAYLVSHGGAAFPDVQFVLQGEGITLVLDGQTNIKHGVTSSTFDSVPDAPVSVFETVLPAGPHSVLTALGNLCTQSLVMPTTITGQNGAVIQQNTKIAVTGCPPSVKVTKTALRGKSLLVTVSLSQKGTVKISGSGLKTTTKKNVSGGTHQIRMAFTKAGVMARSHHKKLALHVSLTVGRQAVSQTTTLRL